MALSPLFALDVVRLMMALTQLTLFAILWMALESMLAYGWPDRFQTQYTDVDWYRLYLVAALTFPLTYLVTLWLLYASSQYHHPLWHLAGVVVILCAVVMGRVMVGLVRLLHSASRYENATS